MLTGTRSTCFTVVGAEDTNHLENASPSPSNKVLVLSVVALGLAAAGDFSKAADVARRAFALAQTITDDAARPSALGAVTQALAQTGDQAVLRRVFAATDAIENEVARVYALTYCAAALLEINLRDGAIAVSERALAVADAIKNEGAKAEALSRTARAFQGLQEQKRSLQLLRQAIAAARSADRAGLFTVLTHSAAVIGVIDNGATLWSVYNAVKQVEGWWGAQACALPLRG